MVMSKLLRVNLSMIYHGTVIPITALWPWHPYHKSVRIGA